MKLLTLVRHGKSSKPLLNLADFDRPLNERGERDAPRMAERAVDVLPKAQRLITSPARRALDTAKAFAGPLGFDAGSGARGLALEPRIYEASRKALLALVKELPDKAGHVVLFGHNPGFSELAHTLADCPFDDLPTCAVVHLELAVERWQDAAPDCGVVRHYFFPKDGG